MARFSVSHFLKLDLTAPYAIRGGLNIALLLAGLVGVASQAAAVELPAVEAVTYDGPKVTPHEFTGDLRHLPPALPTQAPAERPYRPRLRPPVSPKIPLVGAPTEKAAAISGPLAPMPSPAQNFAGMNFNDTCTGGRCGGGIPPDINGDVGPNHYIQAVNDAYAIYSKAGTLLASFTENQLWSVAPASPCNGNSQGDPVVLYDALADRWILTHFAFATSGGNSVAPFYQCIAASKTSDPVAGGWYFYALQMDPGGVGKPPAGTLNDYGKFGIWHDCLYMGANGFSEPGGTFAGTLFASFSRSDLYSGAALTWSLGFISGTSAPFTMIPSNLSGQAAASVPGGTPNYFVSESQTVYAFEVRKFTPGPNCGGGGSLSTATNVSQTSYTFPATNNVPQPNTTGTLDNLGDQLMQKVQYRNVGAAESLWVVHSVQTAGGIVTPQWAQINVTSGTIATTPLQQQIYAPDTTLFRWMGSLAVDNQGNMALGYSTSNGTSPHFPSIAYSGRLATDPLNTLPQTEVQLVAGLGSQTTTCGGTTPCERWGDYTAMSVDPADDCTFWYTNQYYSSPANGASGNWQTRIGSFKFPSCGPSGTLPSAPTIGTATAGNAQATVSFTPPMNNGGSAITSYTVTSSPGGITRTGTASPITVTGLTNGTSYTFTVTATNSVGTGPASAPSNSVTPSAAVTPPSPPTLTGATASDTSATLSFTAPTSTGGSPITGYTGTCTAAGKTPGTGTGTSSPVLVSGLASGTTYSCTLTATNSAGTSAASNALTVTTLTATCTYSLSPTSQALGAVSANGSIAVTAAAGCAWTAASNATWISITSGSSGSGNGTVIYAVAANSTGSSRTGTLTIAGNTFTVTQGTSALSTIRNALFINASTSDNKTSVLRLINTSNQSGAITATAYNEAGSTVGTSNVVIGTPAARQMLTFTSAQLEAAIGYTPSSSTAKYRIVFAGNLSSFEVINFIKDVASGNLTLGQAQVDNRAASSATTSTRNALFVNASTSTNKTTVLRLINLSSSNGSITATAYDEAGNPIGVSNANIGILAAQQMLSLTSAQLEAAIGFTPALTTAKYRIVFSASLNSFEVLNFIKDVATGSLTLGQEQID